MENSKYTSGEWNIETNINNYPMIMNDDGNVIATLFDTKDGSLFYGMELSEVEENAKLITCAPKLLEALRLLLKHEGEREKNHIGIEFASMELNNAKEYAKNIIKKVTE